MCQYLFKGVFIPCFIIIFAKICELSPSWSKKDQRLKQYLNLRINDGTDSPKLVFIVLQDHLSTQSINSSEQLQWVFPVSDVGALLFMECFICQCLRLIITGEAQPISSGAQLCIC